MKKGQNILLFCMIAFSAVLILGTAPFLLTNGMDVKAAEYETEAVSFTGRSTVSLASVTLDTTAYIYDGTAKKPKVTVKDQYGRTVSPSDYIVKYSNNTKAGTATVSVIGTGTCTGKIYKNFTIKPKSISGLTVMLSTTSFTYSGQERCPAVSVMTQGKSLSRNNDYTVSYLNNINVGTATVTIKGKGNYTGIVSRNYTISGINIGKFKIKLTQTNYIYDGTEHRPSVTVSGSGKTLVNGTHYTVSYVNNINAGTATVIIKGIGNYGGIAEERFRISPLMLSNASVGGIAASYRYTGKNLTPSVTVRYGSRLLTPDKDYTVSYKNNKAVGTAVVTVKGKKNYTGTITTAFAIIPDTTTLKSVAIAGSGLIRVTWAADKGISGYEITYSPSKYFANGCKTRYITNPATTASIIGSLTKGKTYYVKIRAYKTVDGKKVYGAYSSVRSMKIK